MDCLICILLSALQVYTSQLPLSNSSQTGQCSRTGRRWKRKEPWCPDGDSAQQGKVIPQFIDHISDLCHFFVVYHLFLYLRWDFNMRCTHRPRWLLGRQRISQSLGRCLSCRTWRFETDWPLHRWISSSTCTQAKKCPARPILTWWVRQHVHLNPVECWPGVMSCVHFLSVDS